MRIRYALTIASLCLLASVRLHATDIYACYNGISEQGGNLISVNGIQSSQYVQQSFISATTTVFVHGTLTLATIYTDGTGGTPLANPFVSSTHALAFFCAADGVYDVMYSNAGIVTPFTITNIQLCFACTGGGGGGGTPGGSSTQLQYNIAGTSFGGTAGLTWNNSPATLIFSGGTILNFNGTGSGPVIQPIAFTNFGSRNLDWTLTDTAADFFLGFSDFAGGFIDITGSTNAAPHAFISAANTGLTKGAVFGANVIATVCNGVTLTNGGWFERDISGTTQLCGDVTGVYGPTPTAGDASQKLMTTNFLVAPGPIGGTTPNTGAFSTLKVTGLSALSSVCTDASSFLTTSGCSGGGGSGTVNAGALHAMTYYPAAAAAVSGDTVATLDGSGNGTLNSLQISNTGTGVITMKRGTGTAAPASGLSSLWIDSVTGLLSCISNSSSNCLAISGAPGGANGAIQFNNSSVLGGSTFIYDGVSTITGPSSTMQADTLLGGTGCANGTGVTQNLLAKLSAGTCAKLTTADLGIPAFLMVNVGTSFSYPLAAGLGSCVFSNATTAGHLFGASGATAGDCLDLGTSDITTLASGLWVGGQVLTTGAAGTVQVLLQQGQITRSTTTVNGTITVTGDAPTAGACAAEHTTAVAGLLTTDVVKIGFNGDPSGVTGIAPTTGGGVYILAYPKSAGTLGLKVCNDTSSTITVGTLVLNYQVGR